MVLFVHMTQMVTKANGETNGETNDEPEGQADEEMPPLVDETEV